MAVVLRSNYGLNKHVRDPFKIKPLNKLPETDQSRDLISKRRLIMSLVNLCSEFMESVWPSKVCKLPFKQFVLEVLKRSRVHLTVFQVALCYISRMKPVITKMKAEGREVPQRIACGRRVLVAALQIASKYVQDRSYSVSVWSRISGLSVRDLTANEMSLMQALGWNMFVSYEAYVKSCKWLNVTLDRSMNDHLSKREYYESEVDIWRNT